MEQRISEESSLSSYSFSLFFLPSLFIHQKEDDTKKGRTEEEDKEKRERERRTENWNKDLKKKKKKWKVKIQTRQSWEAAVHICQTRQMETGLQWRLHDEEGNLSAESRERPATVIFFFFFFFYVQILTSPRSFKTSIATENPQESRWYRQDRASLIAKCQVDYQVLTYLQVTQLQALANNFPL